MVAILTLVVGAGVGRGVLAMTGAFVEDLGETVGLEVKELEG